MPGAVTKPGATAGTHLTPAGSPIRSDCSCATPTFSGGVSLYERDFKTEASADRRAFRVSRPSTSSRQVEEHIFAARGTHDLGDALRESGAARTSSTGLAANAVDCAHGDLDQRTWVGRRSR